MSILLALPLGLYSGIKSTSDYKINDLSFDELDDDVEIYRDALGVPTIIAKTDHDAFFAQGYEQARDRLFQMEFFKALGNADLARLLGPDLVNASKFLRNLGMHQAAIETLTRTSDENLAIFDAYIAGVNKFIELHKENLPLEFQLIEAEPTPWTRQDVAAIRSALAYDLSFSGLSRELLRTDLAKVLGVERTLEIFPIHNLDAENYFLAQDPSMFPLLSTHSTVPFHQDAVGAESGSNQWVISAPRAKGNFPILSNDPHLGLSTPGIFWEMHLSSQETGLHIAGFALPGAPGIIIGHNDKVAWGLTATIADAIDLFYFETMNTSDGEFYYLDNDWVRFEIVEEVINIKGEPSEIFEIKQTRYGPILNNDLFELADDAQYAMRWVLNENHERDRIFDAFFGLMRAQNSGDIVDALEFFSVPAHNFVFATIDGDIGYQFAGLIPDRITPGSGVIPQNGSDSNFGWNGMIKYSRLYRNESAEFFFTANEKVDKSDDFYISSLFAPSYRADRIGEVLSANNSVTVEGMLELQGDVKNLYAVALLENSLIDLINNRNLLQNSKAEEALDILVDWASTDPGKGGFRMEKDSAGAIIFGAFRIYLEELTIKDELDAEDDKFYDRYDTIARYVLPKLLEDSTSEWFDDVSTETTIETRSDIVLAAFKETIVFLEDKLGSKVSNWKYGSLHKVTFEHVFGEAVPLLNFNEGPLSNDGSKNTLNAAGQTPVWSEEGPEFSQNNGPAMRFVAQVEPSWTEVHAVLSPGESAHLLSENRNNQFQDWINNRTHIMNFSLEKSGDYTTILRKK
ncbi:MAG: penicillin acylase family protein [Candidatus Heimdallarchaeota archaeon]|nr:penicillin acylase family protein [Candidatus Heimdallarchaeota archaeon]